MRFTNKHHLIKEVEQWRSDINEQLDNTPEYDEMWEALVAAKIAFDATIKFIDIEADKYDDEW